MAFYKLYGNPPYFKMSPFGDGHEGPAVGGKTMAMLAALYQNPYAKWYADYKKESLGGLDGLLFDARSLTAKPPNDLPQGRAFYDVGLAAMHTALPDPANNVAMLLRSSPFGSISHSFADQNAFVLDAYGEPLIIASGYYQLYGHPHHVEWTCQTKASNSVLVNGEGQPIRDWNAKGRLAVFRTTAAGDYTVGDAKAAYGGKLSRFDRRVVFLPPIHTGGEPIIVIRDELVAAKPSTFQFLLHALNRMDVDASKQRVTLAKGASRCRVDYLAPTGLTFDQQDRFTQPPFRPAPNQWHLTASTTEPSPAASSLIVIQPYRDGDSAVIPKPQVETQPGYVGVRLMAADRTILVLFRTDGGGANSLTNAQAASLCLVDGQVRSAVMFEGTKLAYGGTALLESDRVASVSCSRHGRQRCLVASDSQRGARLVARMPDGKRETWVQTDGPFLRAVGEGRVPAFKPLETPGQTGQAPRLEQQ